MLDSIKYSHMYGATNGAIKPEHEIKPPVQTRPSIYAWPGIPAVERNEILGHEKIIANEFKKQSELKVTPAQVADIVARHTGITTLQMQTKCRKVKVVDAKKLFCILACDVVGLTKTLVGKYLNQDHSSVIHTIKACKDLLDTEQYMVAIYNACLPEVKALMGQ